jgi:hypothetical protein
VAVVSSDIFGEERAAVSLPELRMEEIFSGRSAVSPCGAA